MLNFILGDKLRAGERLKVKVGASALGAIKTMFFALNKSLLITTRVDAPILPSSKMLNAYKKLTEVLY